MNKKKRTHALSHIQPTDQPTSKTHSENQKEQTIELIKIIKDGTLQDLLIMLKRTNIDLNFFIDGQTALHYSLLLGKCSIAMLDCQLNPLSDKQLLLTN